MRSEGEAVYDLGKEASLSGGGVGGGGERGMMSQLNTFFLTLGLRNV